MSSENKIPKCNIWINGKGYYDYKIEQGILRPHSCGIEKLIYFMYIFFSSVACSILTLFLGHDNIITKLSALIVLCIIIYTSYNMYLSAHENDHLTPDCYGKSSYQDINEKDGIMPFEDNHEARVDFTSNSNAISKKPEQDSVFQYINQKYLPILFSISSFITAISILGKLNTTLFKKLAIFNVGLCIYFISYIQLQKRQRTPLSSRMSF